MSIDDVTKGILSGIFIGILVMYSFQPQVPYPQWMLQPYENPWMFLVLIFLVVLLLAWDLRTGGLAFLIVATLVMDYYALGTRSIPDEVNVDEEDVDEDEDSGPKEDVEEFMSKFTAQMSHPLPDATEHSNPHVPGEPASF